MRSLLHAQNVEVALQVVIEMSLFSQSLNLPFA
jgi:hypothetical protein